MNSSLLLSALVLCLLGSCTTFHKQDSKWEKAVDKEISELGAYNWIVITESAYPAPGRPSAHSIISPEDIPNSLNTVLESIESSGHVKPRIYLTREAFQVTDDYAPGIETYRTSIVEVLNHRRSQQLPASSLESLLKGSKSGNRVLIIKTPTALPYTSVYIELESGYWDAESETALRKNES